MNHETRDRLFAAVDPFINETLGEAVHFDEIGYPQAAAIVRALFGDEATAAACTDHQWRVQYGTDNQSGGVHCETGGCIMAVIAGTPDLFPRSKAVFELWAYRQGLNISTGRYSPVYAILHRPDEDIIRAYDRHSIITYAIAKVIRANDYDIPGIAHDAQAWHTFFFPERQPA